MTETSTVSASRQALAKIYDASALESSLAGLAETLA